MPQTLTYAPTPPCDRVEVIWQGYEFEMTIPARITLRGMLFLVLLAAVMTAGFCFAFNPAANTPVMGRIVSAIVGGVSGLAALALLRQGRTWARLTLRKGKLQCELPSLTGFQVKRFLFSSFADASVGRSRSKRDRGRYLLLKRHTGGIEQLLNDSMYRVGDLEVGAAAIREAIARRAAAQRLPAQRGSV